MHEDIMFIKFFLIIDKLSMRNKFNPFHHYAWRVPSSRKESVKVLLWVHALLANIKGNIRGVYNDVSPKHLLS
jgi:hypothetical protein